MDVVCAYDSGTLDYKHWRRKLASPPGLASSGRQFLCKKIVDERAKCG